MGNFETFGGKVEIKDKELIRQITNVLRLKIGDSIILGDGKLNRVTVVLEDLRGGKVKAKVVKREKNTNESEVYTVLYCAILKRENFELVVQKATEIGVKEIVPLITERTVKTGFKKERLEKIIKEAAEQSGRGVLPILREPIGFDEALNVARENDANIIFDISGKSLKETKIKTNNKLGIFIGPEGGWSERELAEAREAGVSFVTLGKLTLRAETAAIVASYLMTNFTS